MCKKNKNRFSKALVFTLVALMLSSFSYAQKPSQGFQVGYKVEGRDTVYQIKLRDTYMFSWPEEKKKGRAWRDFYRLVYNFRKTYPYALIAKEKFGIADSVLNSRKFTSRQKTAYIKDFEKDLFKDFEKPLRKMTISQGGLLLKLIDREIGQSSYQIIKDYRGGFNAVFWQGIAKIFGSDLKKPYDKFGEDKITEDLVIMYQNGVFEDLYYSIF